MRRRASPFAGIGIGFVQYFEVVVESAHPWRHLLFFGTGQETDIFADRHGHAGDDDFIVELGFQYLGQACCKCQQGFSGACLTQQGDEIAFWIHQQIERKILLAIARRDAPYAVLGMSIIAQRLDDRCLAVDLRDLSVERRFAIFRFHEHKLIDQERWHQRAGQAVVGVACAIPVFLPRLDSLAVLVPEIIRQLQDAGVE